MKKISNFTKVLDILVNAGAPSGSITEMTTVVKNIFDINFSQIK